MKKGTRKTEYVVQGSDPYRGWLDLYQGNFDTKTEALSCMNTYIFQKKTLGGDMVWLDFQIVRRETIEFVEDV